MLYRVLYVLCSDGNIITKPGGDIVVDVYDCLLCSSVTSLGGWIPPLVISFHDEACVTASGPSRIEPTRRGRRRPVSKGQLYCTLVLWGWCGPGAPRML